jgi:formate hydrogenlyase transcriptional activator
MNALAPMLAEISARLLAASPGDFDAELQRTIERFVRFFDADRGSLGRFDADGILRATHQYAREGIPPVEIGPMAYVPSWTERVRDGSGMAIRSVDDIPPGWTREREYVREVGMKAHIMFPLRVGEAPFGFIALGSFRGERDWSDDDLLQFRLFGEIIASAIVRCEKEKELRKSLEEISRLRDQLEAENVLLREEIQSTQQFDEIVGQSAELRRVLRLVEQVAPTTTSVLLTGETGTGKELVARAIHDRSERRQHNLVAVNCAALPGTLIESELFGYERGAFTGAHQRRLGRFEVAHGGTIFLDEIGDLPLDLQGRLLRVVEEGTFERVGSSQTIRVDVRVIAATNRDLAAAVRDGRWRSDLYYRLRVFPIEIPPLRARREDLPLLAWFFVTRKQASLGKNITRIPERAMEAFQRYGWPGNVRELENVIERALILSSGETLFFDEHLLQLDGATEPGVRGESLEEIERAHILQVLEDCRWKISGPGNAADRLGLNRSTLRSRMERLGIRRPAV